MIIIQLSGRTENKNKPSSCGCGWAWQIWLRLFIGNRSNRRSKGEKMHKKKWWDHYWWTESKFGNL